MYEIQEMKGIGLKYMCRIDDTKVADPARAKSEAIMSDVVPSCDQHEPVGTNAKLIK